MTAQRKLLVLSDLHLEHRSPKHPFVRGNDEHADVVILAGDIHVGVLGLEWARRTFPNKEIVYVAGNHEFFGQRWDTLIESMREAAQTFGIHFLENDEATVKGIRFLGTTMWTDFKFFGSESQAEAMAAAEESKSDYWAISLNEADQRIRAGHTLERHLVADAWLRERLETGTPESTVVVTHHYPCRRSTAPRFREDILTATCGAHMDTLFGKMGTWIHGHTHTSFDYVQHGTRVVCNPRGHLTNSDNAENPSFDPSKLITVGG